MQKHQLKQLLSHKLSPQQIQFIKLLQIPTAELESRIEEELEINPALEEGKDESSEEKNEEEDYSQEEDELYEENTNEYEDDSVGYKMQGDGPSFSNENQIPLVSSITLHDSLMTQLGLLKLDGQQYIIGEQIVGSIDADGYLRREILSIVNDLAFSQNIELTTEEVEQILFKIQQLDPPGIAARNLQECLLLQLERKNDKDKSVLLAKRIVSESFDDFTKKHYDKILHKFHLKENELKELLSIITKLNPKPGVYSASDSKTNYIIPDFILLNNNGKLEIILNSKNAPSLRVSSSYVEMLSEYNQKSKKDKKMKEAVSFVKQKIDLAKWFIDAIKQRQNTLLLTMNAIIEFQYDFFLEGEGSKLKPMILKDIASKIKMDVSTVSRIVNSKYIQTNFGIFPLKYFFSEGILNESGEDISTKEIKNIIKEMVEDEDKKNPLSDEKLEKMLHDKGYIIARRTIAKYREQLEIPVARLRKKI